MSTPIPPRKKSHTGLALLLVLVGVTVLCVSGVIVTSLFTAIPDQPKSEPQARAPAIQETELDHPDAPKGPVALAIGATVTVETMDGTGTVAVSAPAYKKGPFDGTMYVVVTVDVKALTGTMTYNPLNFTLRDAQGVEYSAGLMAGMKAELQSGTLGAGQFVHGVVPFEAPASALHSSTVNLEGLAYWTLP